MDTATPTPKPFHEAIVDVLMRLNFSHPHGKGALSALKIITVASAIPKNHDAIAEAFKRKLGSFDENPTDLLEHLVAEKARHAAIAKKATKEGVEKSEGCGEEAHPGRTCD